MASQGTLQGLEGFEQLDLGELYYIGNRTFVERGLSYYRDYAVESLEWVADDKEMVAMVQGTRGFPYEVILQVRDGRLEHECDCPAWDSYGGCKHAVAAVAAMFLALQGKSVGGFKMPEDYAQELRKGLGYAADGTREDALETAEPRKTELFIDDLGSYGSIHFLILGPTPEEFLRSVGVTMPNAGYGFRGQREFWLGDVGRSLPKFLRKAKKAGIPVFLNSDGEQLQLQMSSVRSDWRQVLDLREDRVQDRLVFTNSKGKPVEVAYLHAEFGLLITTEGKVQKFAAEVFANGRSQIESFHWDHFNEEASFLRVPLEKMHADGSLLVGGEVSEAEVLPDEAVSLVLDCSMWTNAANEPEWFNYALSLRLGSLEVDFDACRDFCLGPLLDVSTGTLLGAKRRVSALLDMLRRLLADTSLEEYVERLLEDFPELASVEYRGVVLQVVNRVLALLKASSNEGSALAVDGEAKRWLAYRVDLRKVLMLFYSMAEPTSRRSLIDLREGTISIKRGTSGMDVVQRVVQAAKQLGVEVRFNELPVRTAPLSIEVDTKASGSDIDWFALHPTIRCAEQTIQPDEWLRLIQGQLLLEGADGALILPEFDGGAEGGLQVLADLLRSKRKSGTAGLLDEGDLVASRLEMLDWIALRKYGVGLSLPPEAEALFKGLTEFSGVGDFELPAGIDAELRGYQLEGCAWIEFLHRHRFGACLADDMGLGKTLQAISFIAKFLQDRGEFTQTPVLVVLPPSLVFNWVDEFKRFAPGVHVVECLQKTAWADALVDGQVILTTYDRVRIDQKELESHAFEIVVFDEAHNLKNVAAARTKAAAKLTRRFTLCLTGTPVENNASEYYSVMSAAVPGLFGSLKAFKESFRTAPDRILGRSKPFILRRTKKEILTELPAKEEHELFLQMSPMQKEIYTRTVAEVREEIADAYDVQPEQQAGIVALAAILRLRQVCVSPELLGKTLPEPAPKFEYMADKLEELQAEGHAALVFSQFIGGLDQLEAVAQARGIEYLRMDGGTPVARRREIVESFQSGKGPSFFFISLKTGGVGLNLTRANYVFHLDPWWNPSVENQASDRAHRIGQTRSVFVQRLIMQHSIEARMLELKARKAELFRQLVDEPGRRTAQAGLQRDDFEYLLNG